MRHMKALTGNISRVGEKIVGMVGQCLSGPRNIDRRVYRYIRHVHSLRTQ